MKQQSFERIQWYRTPIEKAALKQLTRRSDLRGGLQLAVHLALVIAAGVAAFHSWYHWHPAWTVALLWLYGTVVSFLGAGAAGHELSHRTVFRTRWLNEAAMVATAFVMWFNYPRFRASHGQHHQFTVHYPQDLEVVLPRKVGFRDWLGALTFNPVGLWQRLRTHALHATGRLLDEWEHRLYDDHPAAHRGMIRWVRLLLVGQAALAAAFVYFGLWPLLILVSLCGTYAGWFNFLCAVPQHVGMTPDHPDFRIGCRSMNVNPIAAFLYWHMHWHIEHHMYAGVPFFNLRKLRKLIEHDMPPARGLLASWREIHGILRRQKHDPSYSYMPELPGDAQSQPDREG